MKCPSCQVELKMADREGVEIDYCPDCRGVWLDRGELDKIIDRSERRMGGFEDADPRYEQRGDYDRRDYDRKRRRKSFLGEIFDFD